MEDIAAKAGVSQATVSYVLGGRAASAKVSLPTRQRILDMARELGYERDHIARAMVTGKSRIIGVLTMPHMGENVVRILTGAMDAASESDYLLKVLHLSHEGIDDATISQCLKWRIAGAMVIGFTEQEHVHLRESFRKSKISLTVVDNVPAVNWGIRIGSDDDQGIRSVVSHLLSLGHRRIAFMGGGPALLSDWREQSFRAALAEAGITVPPSWVRQSSWVDQSVMEAEVQKLFSEGGNPFPTAVACSSDAIALVVMRVARTLGLHIPRDLSVAGYSNSMLSAYVDPPLTTVDQSFMKMGRAAALQAIGAAEGTEPEEEMVSKEMLLPTQLIERASTAPPPSDKKGR